MREFNRKIAYITTYGDELCLFGCFHQIQLAHAKMNYFRQDLYEFQRLIKFLPTRSTSTLNKRTLIFMNIWPVRLRNSNSHSIESDNRPSLLRTEIRIQVRSNKTTRLLLVAGALLLCLLISPNLEWGCNTSRSGPGPLGARSLIV